MGSRRKVTKSAPRSAPVKRRRVSEKRRPGRVEVAPCPVVGVGASAGGLEAFSVLLRKIPKDTRLAVILVQHLSPHHESYLPTLLRKATTLTLREAEDGMPIQAGHVYVIPPDA